MLNQLIGKDMIGTAIVSGVMAAASIAGGIAKTASARRAQRRQQAQLDAEKAKNEAWYNRRYNEDALQRDDNRRLLTQARESLMASSRAAAGTAAMGGATNAEVAAQKEANNKAYADIASSVAANASAQKDAVEEVYMNRDAQLAQAQMEADMERSANQQAAIDNAVQGVNAVGSSYLAAHTPKTASATETPEAAATTDIAKVETPKAAPAPVVPSTAEKPSNNNPYQLFGSDYWEKMAKKINVPQKQAAGYTPSWTNMLNLKAQY